MEMMVKESPIEKLTLTNSNGVEVSILSLGGIISNILLPNKNGLPTDIVLGFDDPVMYKQDHPYFGGIIGRVANRISRGEISLTGTKYKLQINNEPNHIHGGNLGFDKVIWDIKDQGRTPNDYLVLHYVSKDGEEGYPGNLDVSVRYELNQQNELIITYSAKSDRLTVVNLTNHSYFNLSGYRNSTIMSHSLSTPATHILELDTNLIPTGNKLQVENTAFDFTRPQKLGDRINDNMEQIKIGNGYDHYFILPNNELDTLRYAATLLDEISERKLEIWTTNLGFQLYTGNYLDVAKAKGNQVYKKHHGVCLETQGYPDAPNKLEFPSIELKEGEPYLSKTVYKFSY